MKKIVLIGASGFIGAAILKEVLNRGLRVLAIVRHPEKITDIHQNLTVKKGDVSNVETVVGLCKVADAVISAYNRDGSTRLITGNDLRLVIEGGFGKTFFNEPYQA